MDETAVLTADAAALSHDARLAALEQVQLLRARVDVAEQRLLAAIAASDGRREQWVREEVAVVLRLAPQTTAGRLATATELVERLPATLAAMSAGRVTMPHARALVDAVDGLPDAAAGRVQDRVLARCDGKSVAEFRAHCRRAALAVDPRSADERHEDAAEQRTITFTPELHGMATMTAFLPASDMAKIRQRVESCAAAVDDAGRTAAQRRADAFTDLVLTGTGAGTAPRPIQVIASLSTLRGLSDEPGELDGEPVAASVVRQLAHEKDTWWRPVLVDDEDGQFVTAGAYAYRPSAALRRQIELRDRTCRFLGCRRRGARTEIDHIVAFGEPDGLTVQTNLHCLCRRHHRLKHETDWHVTRRHDGVTVWHSPTGRRYEKPPDPYPGGRDGSAGEQLVEEGPDLVTQVGDGATPRDAVELTAHPAVGE